jgi:hypothetical protein
METALTFLFDGVVCDWLIHDGRATDRVERADGFPCDWQACTNIGFVILNSQSQYDDSITQHGQDLDG